MNANQADLRGLTVAEGLERLREGRLDAAGWSAAYAPADDELGAYLWRAEAQAESAQEGELGGAPVAVKDIFCTEGIATTAGSRILEGHEPLFTATAVERLREAGASIAGKTNMDEFAMGSSNENSAFGPVHNPWARGRVPGGSSGGSAAAVAGGLAAAAIGTDTGGSIRQPASLCGIVGLKPTYGAVSRYGMIAFASSLDQCGPLTRDVTDAGLLLGAMEGRDPCDSTSVGIEGGVEPPSRTDLSGLRFGVAADFSAAAEGVESGVAEVFERSVALIAELGGEVVEVTLPHADHGLSAYYVIAPAEASANLARFDGVRYGLRATEAGELTEMYERTREAGFGQEVKRRIMLGTYALSAGYYDAYYGQALRVRTRIAEDFGAAFQAVDFLITPTSPCVAFEIGAKTADPLAMYLSDYFTVPMSLAGIPAISIPAGLAEPPGGGPELPVGLQIASPAFTESRLLDAAYALEQAIGFEPLEVGVMSDWSERYQAVIGLEVHVQLSTRTKMFCGCEPSFGDEPNVHTCPVCLAHPGTLPAVNEQAVVYGLAIALALECEVAPRSIFHRKNYFYPDIPKGYQISQYDIPLARSGSLGEVRVHRVHLEEDTAKMIHVGESGRIHASTASLVDFNRAGTPLVEIVTEPDLHAADAAREWAQLLRETVRQTGASDVSMEEGSLRCDANVSLRPIGSDELGTKTELKNMNSFRFLERGIAAELERQAEVLDAGGQVEQETLHYDPVSGSITSLRSKEYAHDYRYLPEPDLEPLEPDERMLGAARALVGELPAQRQERYRGLGLSDAAARQLAFDAELAAEFEAVIDEDPEIAPVAANWLLNDLTAVRRQLSMPDAEVSAEHHRHLLKAISAKELSHQSARQVLSALVESGGEPAAIAERLGLAGGTDASELESIVEQALAEQAEAAEKVRSGKDGAIGPIVGAVMRATKGRADGNEVTRLIREKLGL